MSNRSNENLGLTSPEYQESINKLYEATSFAMDNNPSFVVIYDRWSTYTVSSLQLESETGDLITLERTLKNPLSKDPDWSSVLPRIQKAVTISGRGEFLHDYEDRDGLIIDNYNLNSPSGVESELDASDAIENEFSLEDVLSLTNEIKTWKPIDQPYFKKSRVAKVVAAILSRV